MAGTIKPRPLRLKFHAVSIVPGPKACAQVAALEGKRLLSVEAPRLPLVGCSRAADCACRFKHHDDRRAGPRRSSERGSLGTAWANTNRRHARGRRDEDYADA
jgi:hypothetical protein